VIGGFLDHAEPDQVMGWAIERERPDEHLVIDVYCSGRHLGSTIADKYRPGLAKGGIGDGDHGFAFRFATPLEPAELGAVIVRARSESNPTLARELPRFVADPDSASVRPGPIVPTEPFGDDAQFPVFVLGAPRSGTSAVAQALVASTRYAGFAEGQILDLLSPLLNALAHFYQAKMDEIVIPDRNTMIKKVPQRYFVRAISLLFADAVRPMFPDRYWCDKTPTAHMIWTAPRLLDIWPNARFIFLKRRGIENIRSRILKFHGVSFEDQCVHWISCMEAWRSVRGSLAGRTLELDQHFVARHPDKSAAAIAKLLDLDAAETEALAKTLRHHEPQRSSVSISEVVDAAEVGWDTAQWAIFDRVCGPTMTAYGYSRDKGYYVSTVKERGCVAL